MSTRASTLILEITHVINMFTTNLGPEESKFLFSSSRTSPYEFPFALISVVISTYEQLIISSLSQI